MAAQVQPERVEEVMVVLVPRAMHKSPAVVQAKLKELKNYKDKLSSAKIGSNKLSFDWVFDQA